MRHHTPTAFALVVPPSPNASGRLLRRVVVTLFLATAVSTYVCSHLVAEYTHHVAGGSEDTLSNG